jgi:uncharacterized protein (TIGR03437 family)
MKSLRILSLLALGAAALLAQPTITSVTNGASYIPAGVPNSGVAQGALFVVKGSNLGPATFVVANAFPLQTTIAGTSVRVTVAGTTVNAIMYYSGATQVAAILPSSTPVGTGTFTVTYNGQTSSPAPITVVQNALGVFTVSQSGSGDAIVTLGSGFVTPTNAANPREIVVLWATGLGPVTFNETEAAVQSDMTSVPVEAFVGGKTANVVFRGRNGCCAAVDTIYVEIPAGVAGCSTPVTFKIGNIVSNTTTVPVAASGRTCTPTTPGVSQSDLTGLFSKGTISTGGVSLSRSVSTTPSITVGGFTVPGTTTRTDFGGASFTKVTVPGGAIGLSSLFDIATYGSCTVTSYTGTTVPQLFSYQSLDAGASIGVSGPAGSRTLAKSTAGGFTAYGATLDAAANYLNAGQYTVTGPGGADVGSFTAQLNLAQPLTWTNQQAITTVNRAAGVTVNWSGGDPAGYVQISGSSFSGTTPETIVVVIFTCTARTSDGSFTVPPFVLLALPPSGTQSAGGGSFAIPGSLAVSGVSGSTRFQATGLDYGFVSSSSYNSSGVTYQ